MAEQVDTSELDILVLETMIGFNGTLMRGLKSHPDRHNLIYSVGSTVVVENIDTEVQCFLVGHSNTVSCIEISRGGTLIASGQITHSGHKADIIVWDYELKEQYAKFTLHRNSVEALSFSCDDRYLVSLGGQDDGPCVVVWNIQAKEAICGSLAQKASDGIPYVLSCLNTKADMFVTAGRDTCRVWKLNVEDRKISPTDIRLSRLARVSRCIAVDDSDKYFYLGTTTGDVMKVNLELNQLAGHGPDKERFSCGVSSIALLQNGEIIVGCGDGTVAILTEILKKAQKEVQLEGMVTSLAVRGLGTQIFAGTALSNIYLITNLGTKLTMQLIKTSHYEAINGLAFPYACSELIVTCSKEDIRVWYLGNRKEVLRINVPNHDCNAVAVMKDGGSIISGWSDCRIRAYLPESGKPMYIMDSTYGASVTAIATYSNCQKIVSGSDVGHVVVWDVPEWRESKNLHYATKHFLLKEHKGSVTSIKLTKDNTECVTSSTDGSCIIWDLVNRHRRHMLHLNNLFMCVCYHPAEHQVVTSGTDRKIGFWETFDASLIRELDGSASGAINTMDISADGAYLVSAGDDKFLKMWKYEEGEITHIGRGHSAPVRVVSFSPNMSHIVSVSADGAILIWKFPFVEDSHESSVQDESLKPCSDYKIATC